MRIHKFESTEAFIAIDLVDAEASSGPVRWAKKVLQGGAKDLARSQTYTYAALGMRRGGASAGISADPDGRGAAIEAFTAEVAALVADGTYLPDAAKGVGEADLAIVRADDPRDTARLDAVAARFDSLSAAVTAEATVGLAGRTVAIEGFGDAGPDLAGAIAARGGTIIAVSTSTGTITSNTGIDADALAEAYAAEGPDCVNRFGEVAHPMAVFGSGAGVTFAGSKTGVVDHTVAGQLTDSAALIASGRLAMTARALAVLRAADVAAPGDFISLAGGTIAAWGDAARSDDQVATDIATKVADLCTEHKDHSEGPFLAACHAAESFLSTWQDTLPFGRPLAP